MIASVRNVTPKLSAVARLLRILRGDSLARPSAGAAPASGASGGDLQQPAAGVRVGGVSSSTFFSTCTSWDSTGTLLGLLINPSTRRA